MFNDYCHYTTIYKECLLNNNFEEYIKVSFKYNESKKNDT